VDSKQGIHIHQLIVAVDPGIIRLGLAIGEIDIDIPFRSRASNEDDCIINESDYRNRTETELVLEFVKWHCACTLNLMLMVSDCAVEGCLLHHSNEMVDRVDHLLQLFPIFLTCDWLLIERQQPGACTDVQNLLMKICDRSKILLMAANSRNKYIGAVKGMDRMQRKRITVMRVLRWMCARALQQGFWNVQQWCEMCEMQHVLLTPVIVDQLVEDCHDAADSLLFIAMHLKQKIWEQIIKQIQAHNQRIRNEQARKMNPDEFFNQFRHSSRLTV